ncbi:MAG TPA: hypothetical protein VMV48_02165 [Gallionellaceae bacterium]|nr:hypothetical protein [Gallionellaceae bacterium]
MNLVEYSGNHPSARPVMEPGTPLWQIVPTRGADGRPLADFMMLIPKLNKCPQHIIDITLCNLQKALEACPDVVFANFNLKLNVLWVSVNCRHGLILELVTSIQNRVPEAMLVA